jgi:hypothetical protein
MLRRSWRLMAGESQESSPGRSVITIRHPHARASRTTNGSPSKKDGKTKTWEALSTLARSSCGKAPRNSSRQSGRSTSVGMLCESTSPIEPTNLTTTRYPSGILKWDKASINQVLPVPRTEQEEVICRRGEISPLRIFVESYITRHKNYIYVLFMIF